ncbi:hypothetical protein D9M69_465720 [compost metagenome]
MARGAPEPGAGRGLGQHRRGPGQGRVLQEQARPGWLHPLQLERGQRDHRRGQRLHRQAVRPRPGGRLLADPGHVDGQLRRRLPLPVADRRRVPELLRLVLRPSSRVATSLGRADRRAGIGRLVQLQLHHRLGFQRPADPYPGRPLLHRGALQGHQDRRHHPGLRRGGQAHRPLAEPQAGYRRGAGAGLRPRDLQGIPPGAAERLLHRLRQALHRPADAGAAEREGRQLPRRTLPARQRPEREPRPGQQPRVEDHRRGGFRRAGFAAGLDRLPLGREGQVEHRGA